MRSHSKDQATFVGVVLGGIAAIVLATAALCATLVTNVRLYERERIKACTEVAVDYEAVEPGAAYDIAACVENLR